MLGYERRTLLKNNALQLLSPGAAAFAAEQADTYRETGDAPILGAGAVELEARRRDGKTFPADVSVSRLPGGSPGEFVVVLRDISQRKVLEEFLRASEAHFHMMADTAPVMLWLTDARGNCTYINKRWLEFTGRRLEQDLGAGWAESIHEEEREEELRSFLQCLSQLRELRSEYRLRRADGQYRWIYDHGVPRYAPDGTLLGYIGACFDITERKAAEKAVEESEAKFRALTETASSAIFISVGDRIEYANRQTELITGYSRKELQDMSFWSLIHPEFRSLVRARREARLSGEKVVPRYEFKIVTANGEERWIDFTATAIEYEGQPAILGTAFDITERKRAEQKLEEQRALLDALAQTSPLAMITVDNAGLVHYCNPAFESLFQFSPHEIVGQPLDELVAPPEYLPEARELTRSNVTGQRRQVTSKRRRKDGTIVDVEIYAVPLVVGGRTVGSYGIYVDLTERRKLQMYEKLLPVCCVCGKIRDDSGKKQGQGEWERLDHYVMKHSDARVSHTFCPHCLEEYKKQEGLK
jgi:PAS domain S-box-containing protein